MTDFAGMLQALAGQDVEFILIGGCEAAAELEALREERERLN